jgi:hypothetical protein
MHDGFFDFDMSLKTTPWHFMMVRVHALHLPR